MHPATRPATQPAPKALAGPPVTRMIREDDAETKAVRRPPVGQRRARE